MKFPTTLLLDALAIGAGATAIMDLWAVFLRRVFGIQGLNYAFVGRLLGHAFRGKRPQVAIAKAPPVPGEAFIGWLAHYAVGIAFAAALLLFWGPQWARNPSLLPALTVGIGTVVFPFLILQPALGGGIAASRMPQPNVARFRSVVTHTVFGLGLFMTALILKGLPTT
jgi:hypothetical protein